MDFSVIIPAYNCERSIAKTVKSLCDVQIEEMEIIIVDDGSTDNTSNECRSLAGQYPLVRYYYQDNQGVSAARNFGISKAIGNFILFWDSDDKADTELLKKCMLTAKEKNADVLMFGMTFYKLYNGTPFQIEYLQCEKEERINKNELGSRMIDLFQKNYLTPVWNKVFKSEIVHRTFFNSSKMCFEDFLYSLEFLRHCDSVYLMPDPAYIYRMEHSSHKNVREKRINDFNEYMSDFQTAVIDLESHLGLELTEFRLKIGLVYEWMLISKLKAGNYGELKRLDKNKMKLTLFGNEFVSSSKIIRLFFDNKLITLRLYSFFHNIRHRIGLRMRCRKYRLKKTRKN